jgi:benzodiazapine receptor
MNKDTLRQLANLAGVIVVLVVNGLAVALPLNGQDTGAISDRFQVYFVPAGYVFSIWGLIYIGLIAFGIFQLLPSQRENPRLRKVGFLFFFSCIANAAWLFLWHYLLFTWTVVVMLILLGLLIAIYLRLGIGRVIVSISERLTTQLTFSVYLGWISVATIANITQILWYSGWDGAPLTPVWWAVIMLAAGVVIAFLITISRADWAYLLVLIWAYIGIAVKQADTIVVANAAWAAVVALAVLAGVALLRPPRRNVG